MNKQPLFFSLLLLLILGSCWQCQTNQNSISYNQHIRPIFNKNCLPCHGGVKQMGDFSLLFEKDAFLSTESGKLAIVPGNAKRSELYQRITHHDPEIRMPQEGQALTKQEKDLVAKWINQGAKWEQHWAYFPPELPALPDLKSDWMKNGIDHFVLEKLHKANLTPATIANRTTLLRRASMDLRGLPPSLGELTTFLNDKNPDAYEKAIDRLLASPNFGERWAALWLDLARYADSRGYEKDAHRNIWRYRDWVIAAFNKDLPFDQFTIEQLAGDLLPKPSRDQLLATAFNRNTMTNDEGGTEDEEFRLVTLIDRINTTFEVWQGTTLGCVQCHSHPYDPIRHEEFYQVMDIFNHTLDNDLGTELPVLTTYPTVEAQKANEIISYIETIEPKPALDKSQVLESQIQQALFPILIPDHCDDFQNIVFSSNGVASNWPQNLQAIGDKKYYFKFSNIDITDLSHISYSYSVNGDDSRMEVRLDKVDGPVIHAIDLPKAAVNRWDVSKFQTIKTPITTNSGTHDLIFEIINTTGKIPDGLLSIGKIELHYKNKYPASAKLIAQKKELIQLRTKADRTPIMQEKSTSFPRTTKVFERGNWLLQTETVTGKVPASLLTPNTATPKDRLAFAKWLVSKENPITARVIVNRFWEQIFGTGIIESLEDFGTQALPASHPELLDYLAVRFRDEHKWSVKALLKEILLSATYQQSSIVTAEKLEKDPYNRLLSRGARFRLSAEQIRDQALAVGGLLKDSIGGKSVMPLQPDGVWEVVYNNQQWKTPKDDSRYRRGLYTYWKRTTPYPSMAAFDSPSREFCVSRRIRTNTPLQALVTLNDPVYLEAAQALGQAMKKAGGGDVERALQFGYQKALLKTADATTLAVLKKLYRQAQEAMQNPAPKVIPIAQENKEISFDLTEPMTVVANAIMNLDGFVMKE